ncbi:MAG: type II toxin-antitoxin system HipA family toxin [Clostridiales Family XIII bacterium]|jgi:serine/threonine-protein kinase HipA|nr:type II toxin-antitoxin system HipA family toxin [Clostridiales Family XIII bacterium]
MIDLPEIAELAVHLYGRRAGRLTRTRSGLCAFQYDPDFLRDGFSVSPLKLPLSGEVFVAEALPFDGNFGVFDDSLPDGWGRLLQDRVFRDGGIDPGGVTTLQRLWFLGAGGRGALEYSAPDRGAREGEEANPPVLDGEALTELANKAEAFYAQEDAAVDALPELFLYGGSSGGARPKAFVKADGTEWLVKFRASSDPPDVGPLEYEMSLLAKACGIDMPETRLFEGRYFGSERFDRAASGKIHVASAADLLHADYRIPSLDYRGLLTLCRVLTRSISQCEQMFRRMVFNVAIGNRDDHAKNFSFVMDGRGEWSLSPAYDLLPATGFGGQHTTTVNGNGNPTREDMLAVSASGGLTEKQATGIIDEICTIAEKHEMVTAGFNRNL